MGGCRLIYFISNLKGSIKIGYTADLKRRLSEHQISNPDVLRTLYYIEDGDIAFEHHVQGVCERYHISGEWYKEEVIEKHLLKHPWFRENIKKYENI